MGIDLTSTEAKPNACLGMDRESHLACSDFLYQDSDILGVVSRHGFELAAIAAYTAFLHIQGKTELLGNAEEGAICLPFLDRVAYDG